MLLPRVEEDIVRDVALPNGELLLNDRMTATVDVDDIAVVHDGTDVAVLLCALGEGQEAIKLCQERCILLNWSDVLGKRRNEFVEELCLEGKDAFLGPHDFVFVFLEFLGDVALSLSERLLANPFGRHLVAIGIANLKVVTEDVVVANLEALDTRGFYLALLHLQQVALALVGDMAQVVQFGIDAVHDDAATCHL